MFVVTLAVLLFVVPSSVISEPIFDTIPLRFDLIIEQLRYTYQHRTDLATDLINHRIATIPFEELITSKSLSINQSTSCERDLQVLINATSQRQLWALKVLDAWGKPLPSGLLKGNTFWVGNYDECVNPLYQLNNKSFVQQPFNTQYCALLSNPNNDPRMSRSGLTLGICVPASCTRQSIVTLVHELFQFENFTDAYLHCSNDRVNEQKGLSAGTIAISVVLSFLALVVLIGTIIDLVVDLYLNKYKGARAHIRGYDDLSNETSNKNLFLTSTYQSLIKQMPFVMFLAEFSAIRTLKHIFTVEKQVKENTFTFINGIRVLSLFWVILGHSFTFGISYLSNVYDLLAASRNIAFQFITSGVLSVDTFFILSGFLTAILFVRQVRKEKLTFRMIGLYYVHRYLRLTPTFILVMFVSIYLTPYFGHGPLYPIQQGFEPDGCRNGYWWTSFLYIGNLVKPDNMCLGVTWYLFNDMQFHWIAPLALIPFALGRKAIGYIVTILFVLVSIGSILGLALYYPSLVTHALDVSSNVTGPTFFNKIYITPWCRISPYAIGLLTGFVVISTDRTYRLNRGVQIIGNLLATATALACIFSLYGDYVLVPGLNRASLIAYQVLSRPAWSLSVSWLLFLCSINQGGIVNRILSFSVWTPLARLNYAAYLIHSTVIFVTLFNLTIPLYYQPMTFVNNYVSQLIFSYLAAIVVVIFFETPFFILEKRIFKR